MNISCVAMVRNESDIIEAFCRHLAALFDVIVLIDHGSVDGTREYLAELSRSDPRFNLYDFTEPAYEQSALITFAVKKLPPMTDSDWVFLLDADELLPFPDAETFRSRLRKHENDAVVYMHWSNLVPKDFSRSRFDLSEQVWRGPKPSPYVKVAFQPKKLPGPEYWISQGNHELLVRRNGRPVGGVTTDFPLLHVPIRSADQFCLKLAQGIAAYSLRDRRSNKLEGFHWSNIYDVSRASGLQPEVLNWIAINYGQHLDTEPEAVAEADLRAMGYTEERLDVAQDEGLAGLAGFTPTSEVLFRVCAELAAGARRDPPPPGSFELRLDDQNRIDLQRRIEPVRYPPLPTDGWPASPELDPVDGFDLLAAFLRPAAWPVKCLTPTAWGGHIPFMFCLFAALRPRRYVELGSHFGASFFAACQAAQRTAPASQCIAVDLWTGDEHAGEYDESVFEEFTYQLDRHFSDVGSFIRSTFDEAAGRFEPASVDLLHIDGLHTYEAVKHDFETWKDRLTAGGVIIFHDVNVHERDFGVWELWDQLKQEYPTTEFFHSHGLGVLCLGDSDRHPIRRLIRLFQQDAAYGKFTQWLLQNLGELTVYRAQLDGPDGFRSRLLRLERHFKETKERLDACLEESEGRREWIAKLEGDVGDTTQRLISVIEERDRAVQHQAAREEELAQAIQQQLPAAEETARLHLRLGQLERELEDERLRCERTVAEIYNTSSWKLTAPLRRVVGWLRRLLRRT